MKGKNIWRTAVTVLRVGVPVLVAVGVRFPPVLLAGLTALNAGLLREGAQPSELPLDSKP